MSNLRCPRSSRARVSGTGISVTSLPPTWPRVSAGFCTMRSRGTVPGGGWRMARPSSKNGLDANARAFGWRSIGSKMVVSPQAASSAQARTAHGARAQLEQGPLQVSRVLSVLHLGADPELVEGSAAELLGLEHRVVGAREAEEIEEAAEEEA